MLVTSTIVGASVYSLLVTGIDLLVVVAAISVTTISVATVSIGTIVTIATVVTVGAGILPVTLIIAAHKPFAESLGWCVPVIT